MKVTHGNIGKRGVPDHSVRRAKTHSEDQGKGMELAVVVTIFLGPGSKARIVN